MENNNKESFQLLAGLSHSDSASEIQEFALPQRKQRRVKRRVRGRVSRDGSSEAGPSSCCCCGGGSKARFWRLGLGISLLGAWMLAISWVALAAHGDVASLDVRLQTVSSSSDGVSTELYQCRSASRQLQLNQSHLAGQLENLTAQLNNITTELNAVTAGLSEVQKRVKEAPQLVAMPKQLADLSSSVANLGSQIQDLRGTATQLQTQSSNAATNITLLLASVQTLNATAQAQLSFHTLGSDGQEKISEEEKTKKEAALKQLTDQLNAITANLTLVNTSLSGRLEWARNDITKHHKDIEALQEASQNVSARVTTLEGECSVLTGKLKPLETNIIQMNSQVAGTTSRTTQLESRVGRLQELYGELQATQASTQARLEHLEPQSTSTAPPTFSVVSQSPTSAKPAAVSSVPSQPLVSASTSTLPTIAAEG